MSESSIKLKVHSLMFMFHSLYSLLYIPTMHCHIPSAWPISCMCPLYLNMMVGILIKIYNSQYLEYTYLLLNSVVWLASWYYYCDIRQYTITAYHGSTPGWVLPYLGKVGRFCGDDSHFGDFQSDWVPILYLNTI